MTYQTTESSVEDGLPIYKFLFVIKGAEYRFTSAPYFISDSVGTWEPLALRVTEIASSGEMAKNGVQIEIPRTASLATMFLSGPIDCGCMDITIYRGHDATDLQEFIVIWKGRVTAHVPTDDRVVLECEDVFTSMRRPGLRARYQKSCRHALYSNECGVNKAAFGVSVDLTSETGLDFEFAYLDSVDYSDGYFTGGILELPGGEARYIMNHTGNTVTIISAFNSSDVDVDSVGVSATLYPGCMHTPADCSGKFSNLHNYGGFPYMPGKNPFAGSVDGSIV